MKKITTALTIAAAAVAANAICEGAGTVNTSIWFDGSDQQVNTGGDGMYKYAAEGEAGGCTTTKMGYWYDYDDRKNDHGGSYVVYPYDPDQYKSLIAPMIDELGYVAVKYVLVDPTTTGQTADYPYNFVGMGFNTVDAAKTALDITAAGGLCATWTADHDITLEIQTAGDGDASCAVTLEASTTPKMQSFPASEFAQPSWAAAQKKALAGGCAQAFSAASAVKFKVDGGASDIQGVLRIFEVGPAGTCKGGKSIGAEPGFTKKSNGDGGLEGDVSAIHGAKVASSAKMILSGRTLSFTNANGASYEIVSLQGQVVKSGVVSSSVSLASLNAGIYMIRVSGKSVSMSQKIILK
jgi:hypothetical protein